MSATVVLRSQDCLSKPSHGSRRNACFYKDASRCRRRKRNPTVQDRSRVGVTDHKSSPASPATAAVPLKSKLVMGQVKILKRGEVLPDLKDSGKPAAPPTASLEKLGFGGARSDEGDLISCYMGRLGPDPETVKKQVRASDFYAGSGPIVASPPPSSLPFPAFFSKEKRKIDAATNDLLSLLRLDLS